MLRDFIMPRLCVSSLIWRRRGIGDVARAMMRLGLTKLELACSPMAPQHHRFGEANTSLFNVLAEAGIHVLALRVTGLEYGQKVEAIAEAGKRGIPLVLDRAERLNFPDMVDRLQIYAICAAQAGVQFILENDAHSSCDNAAAQMALAKVLRHPAVGFALAPPHALAGGLSLPDEIKTLGNRLKLAYLWDAPAAVVQKRRPGGFPDHLFDDKPLPPELELGGAEGQLPGNSGGMVDWRGYFQALAENSFRGIFNLAWQGGEDWTEDQTDEAVRSSIQNCIRAAESAEY